MTLAQTNIGYRAFIGNSSLIPAGTTIGDNTLIGVLTLPPDRATNHATAFLGGELSAATPDTTWLGLARPIPPPNASTPPHSCRPIHLPPHAQTLRPAPRH